MRLYVGGMGLRGDGYPNAERTVELLAQEGDIDVVSVGRWLPEELRLWELTKAPRIRAVRWLLVLAFGNLRSVFAAWKATRSCPGFVYVPYPSIFFLFWISLIPRSIRPFCIVDSFISVWDSLFRDRSSLGVRRISARALKWLESRALRAAEVVLVDTEANRDEFIDLFGLSRSRVRSVPLAIEEDPLLGVSEQPQIVVGRPLRVLFVGTMIPLHGIDIIVGAISLLQERKDIEFRLIGDGQQSYLVENALREAGLQNLTWVRGWQSLSGLAAEIQNADICLGVFGSHGKSSRVLPFKLYMYLAAGRAVISQAAFALPDGVPRPPIVEIKDVSSAALASAILGLNDDGALRRKMGLGARDYYKKHLSNECVIRRWQMVLDEVR